MKITSRRRARECAVQALYSWQLSDNDLKDIEMYFLDDQDISDVDIDYFHELYIGVTTKAQELDKLMEPYLISRHIKKLDYVEHAVLRIAIFELSNRFDVPFKVTINEAIELVKTFGAKDSYKFINGVLDKIALHIRSIKK